MQNGLSHFTEALAEFRIGGSLRRWVQPSSLRRIPIVSGGAHVYGSSAQLLVFGRPIQFRDDPAPQVTSTAFIFIRHRSQPTGRPFVWRPVGNVTAERRVVNQGPDF